MAVLWAILFRRTRRNITPKGKILIVRRRARTPIMVSFFISHMIVNGGIHKRLSLDIGSIEAYEITIDMLPDVYEQWF